MSSKIAFPSMTYMYNASAPVDRLSTELLLSGLSKMEIVTSNAIQGSSTFSLGKWPTTLNSCLLFTLPCCGNARS